jgi:hypothetical protein
MEPLRPQAGHNCVPSGELFYGVTAAAILQGEFGDVTLYSDREPVDTGDITSNGTISAIAVFDSIGAGKKVLVHRAGAQYRIIGGEC